MIFINKLDLVYGALTNIHHLGMLGSVDDDESSEMPNTAAT